MAVQQLERGVGVVEQVELAVGLVEDHADVARDPLEERLDVARAASAVEVGLFGLQTMTRRVATVTSRGHRVEVVAVVVVERDRDRARAPEAAARCG